MGLATTATKRTLAASPPSSSLVTRSSWAMIGQSVVHTGSRNVSTTVSPRRSASDTVEPSGAVSVKAGAGDVTTVGAPSTATAICGSADGWTAAAAMGASPTSRITRAPAVAARRPVLLESSPSHQDRSGGTVGAAVSATRATPAPTSSGSGSAVASAGGPGAAAATTDDSSPPSAAGPAGAGRSSAR